jgi:hypothetical protein
VIWDEEFKPSTNTRRLASRELPYLAKRGDYICTAKHYTGTAQIRREEYCAKRFEGSRVEERVTGVEIDHAISLEVVICIIKTRIDAVNALFTSEYVLII